MGSFIKATAGRHRVASRSFVLNVPSSRGREGYGGTGGGHSAKGDVMRFQGGFLLILAAAAVLPAIPASAQGYGGPSVYSEPLPPPPGQRRYDDSTSPSAQSADPRDRRYYPSNSAPVSDGR